MSRQEHTIPAFIKETSNVLILGSFPSVKSRQSGFYYGHPQNRFWRVIAELTGSPVPKTIEDKQSLLINHNIALWDVIQSCDIEGSSDSSIKNVIVNPIHEVVSVSNIKKIFVNGRTAESLYNKYVLPITGKKAILLPSTSPANAAWSIERLKNEWKIIF